MNRCQVSRTTVYRIKKDKFLPDENNTGGRPNKLCAQDDRKRGQCFHAFRKREGLKETEVRNRTVKIST